VAHKVASILVSFSFFLFFFTQHRTYCDRTQLLSNRLLQQRMHTGHTVKTRSD